MGVAHGESRVEWIPVSVNPPASQRQGGFHEAERASAGNTAPLRCVALRACDGVAVARSGRGAGRMKLTSLLRLVLEWLTVGCFILWCVFCAFSLIETVSFSDGLGATDLVFLAWFAAAWWGWAALIWSELSGTGDGSYPLWVHAGLVIGIGAVLFAFWASVPDPMPTAPVSLADAAVAFLALLLIGLAPALLAVDHLRHGMLRI